MAQAVDEKRLRKLIADGVPQRERARRLIFADIPRTSLQRLIKLLGPAPSMAISTAGDAVGLLVVNTGELTAEEIDAVRAEFWELIGWWRERKLQRV